MLPMREGARMVYPSAILAPERHPQGPSRNSTNVNSTAEVSGWPEGIPVTRFLDAYRRVAAARYPVRDSRPAKVFKGSREPRTCALCGRNKQQGATFEKES